MRLGGERGEKVQCEQQRTRETTACTVGNKSHPKQGDRLVGAAALSHSAHCPSQTSQHATAAKSRLRRTAGQTRFDDLAASAEKLPGCTLLTLS